MVSPDYENEVEIERYDFSTALDELKNWKKIAREWWNWKGMYLELQTPTELSKITLPYIYINMPKCNCNLITEACSNCNNLDKVPWLASKTDLLSNDWIIID